MQKWFVEIGVEERDWPAQSPDPNPIEHLGDELEHRLRARPNCPTSVPDLTNALAAEWKQIPAGQVRNGSMRRRCVHFLPVLQGLLSGHPHLLEMLINLMQPRGTWSAHWPPPLTRLPR